LFRVHGASFRARVNFSPRRNTGSSFERFLGRAIHGIAFGPAAVHENKSNLERDQMKTNDLRSMSVDELWTLHEEISSILERRLAEEKAALESRLRQLKPDSARTNNGFQRARRPYPRVLPKYHNPAQPAETWSGRGKQPRWLTALLRTGKKLDDFRIQPMSSRARRSNSGRKQRRA